MKENNNIIKSKLKDTYDILIDVLDNSIKDNTNERLLKNIKYIVNQINSLINGEKYTKYRQSTENIESQLDYIEIYSQLEYADYILFKLINGSTIETENENIINHIKFIHEELYKLICHIY